MNGIRGIGAAASRPRKGDGPPLRAICRHRPPDARRRDRALDSPARLSSLSLLSHFQPMGKQYNKVIKKKRRIAYLKRKKAAASGAKKPAKAKK
ncbi:hypothetical protein [Termitidicoccus mucosus]|uniref:hypothetical protein n=1 Tax=Termitidicoccus mucosus TaxID=1184151 RepID=UPI0011AB65F0